ncbi:MAG: AAA family ATPase, partial [Thermoplasmata archaeon]
MTFSRPDRRALSERHRPTSLDECVGNSESIRALRAWGMAWSQGGPAPRARAVLLEGPPGVGKTTAAYALAHDFGWTVVEMNASDARNQGAIERIAGRAALTQTLGDAVQYRSYEAGARTLIVLDEADSLTGRSSSTESTKPSRGTFRDFVRSRYGSLASLAQAWGLGKPEGPPAFQRWEQVPATGGRGARSRSPAAQHDLGEWRDASRPVDLTDRGGLPAILHLISRTRQPLVLTVNDSSPYSRLPLEARRALLRIRFERADDATVERLLRAVILKEHLAVTREALEAIRRRSQGDLRAALNDLEAIAPLPAGPLQAKVLGRRDQTTDFFDVTSEVLRNPRFYRSVEIRNRLDAPPDDLLPWIEENVPRTSTSPHGVVAGIDTVAASQRLLSFARRRRVWSLWSYASELLTGGVSLRASEVSRPRASGTLAFPQFLGIMGQTRYTRPLRLSIASKIGRTFHVSRSKASSQVYGVLEGLFLTSPRPKARSAVARLRREFAAELELSREEVAFLFAQPVDSKAVDEVLSV